MCIVHSSFQEATTLYTDVSKHTKMKILITLLILFITITSCGQLTYNDNSISIKTKKVVTEIEKVNELMSSAVYYEGSTPKQWGNFVELKKNATNEELIELTNHPNGVVRSYSFWALSNKKDVDLFPIVKNHLNDYQLINTQFGCIGGQKMVGDFFIQVITPPYLDLDLAKISSKELKELDSLLIYQTNKLSSRYAAIDRAETTVNLYPTIRELVIEENNQRALITLAKYQKEQDIEIIKNFRNETNKDEGGYFFTYSAISEFPRPEFIPLLEKNLNKTLDNTHFSHDWKKLYKAIASYKNEKALELLKIPFTQVQHQKIKKYHIDFIFNAILEFQVPIYDELLWKIWEEENQVSLQSYKYLLSLNPSKAYELTKRELVDNYELQNSDFIPNLDNVEFSEFFHEYLLNIIIANDKELSNKIIKEKIENTNVHNLPLFTSKVNQQKRFIEPLFNRLENAWNAHIYLNLIETLISYKDDAINKRILEVRKHNKNLNEGWGAKTLDELLTENNIQ